MTSTKSEFEAVLKELLALSRRTSRYDDGPEMWEVEAIVQDALRKHSTSGAKYALAESCAVIDGKFDKFKEEHFNSCFATSESDKFGHFDGYMSEAKELIKNLETRGYVLVQKAK